MPRYEFSEGSSNKAVKGICPKVVTGDQEEADDWGDGELHRYVRISE